MADISLRAHHVENVAYYKFVNFEDFEKLHSSYNPEFRKMVRGLYQSLLDNPLLVVKIVRGLDDLCNHINPECNLDKHNCLGRSRDELVERHYKLSIGEEYSVEDLIRRAEQFREESGFITPLNWLWRTNDLSATN